MIKAILTEMKTKVTIISLVLSLLGGVAMAQNSNPQIPRGAQVDSADSSSEGIGPMPDAQPPPATIPGGLYRLENGYLSCPDTLPMNNGQPNLRACKYIKEVR
jgi:hypothetical protein